jgi:hypothetical protein
LMRRVLFYALVVVILNGCGGGGGTSNALGRDLLSQLSMKIVPGNGMAGQSGLATRIYIASAPGSTALGERTGDQRFQQAGTFVGASLRSGQLVRVGMVDPAFQARDGSPWWVVELSSGPDGIQGVVYGTGLSEPARVTGQFVYVPGNSAQPRYASGMSGLAETALGEVLATVRMQRENYPFMLIDMLSEKHYPKRVDSP